MRAAHAHRQGGASRLELAVVAILAALLLGVLLDRLIAYRVEAENVAVKQLISSLRTAMSMRSAEAIAGGGEARLTTIAEQNPMDWLQKPPINYLGEVDSDPKGFSAQGWYFDRSAKLLVYLPSGDKNFSHRTQKILVFKVKLLRVTDPLRTHGRRELAAGLVLDQIDDETLALNNSAVMAPRRNYSEKN